MGVREDQRVAIVTATLGTVRIEHETGMLNHIYPIGRRFDRIIITGQSILDARNLAMYMAEKEGFSFLFFWDDDVIPQSPSAFGLIMAAFDARPEADVVGGVYPRRGLLTDPIVIKEPGAGVWWGWKEGIPYTIHKVYMTGTGFMGVRMSSMRKLDLPTYIVGDQGKNIEVRRYFDNTERARTDDFFFADLCMDNNLNWYVAGGAICDQIDLDGTLYRVQNAEIKVGSETETNHVNDRAGKKGLRRELEQGQHNGNARRKVRSRT